MAIGVHICRVAIQAPGEATTNATLNVLETAGVSNSAGNPLLEDFIQDEADDGYLVNVLTDNLIVTASVADVNGA